MTAVVDTIKPEHVGLIHMLPRPEHWHRPDARRVRWVRVEGPWVMRYDLLERALRMVRKRAPWVEFHESPFWPSLVIRYHRGYLRFALRDASSVLQPIRSCKPTERPTYRDEPSNTNKQGGSQHPKTS